ncbi:MAG: response regulator [Lachnospiraceae bacterium]|nr:response regulator [Lachnospiraceae bacterium]
MNIAVCDDEKVIREQINELIGRQKQDINIELYGAGDELLAAEKQFDIVFLDIQMNGTNGIETARKLRERNEWY